MFWRKHRLRMFPELGRFRDPPTAETAFREAQRAQSGIRDVIVAVIALLVLTIVFVEWVEPRLGQWREASQWARTFLSPVYIIGSSYVILRIRRRSIQRHLRRRLIASGVPICLHCGYDLRGLQDARCPECGRSFDARLLLPTEFSSDSVDG
ncbi:MAG: hypothetical protein H6818_00390 [Phycisphaerales bacterium]|nr:hypothetical protein [Phycisphaerales bacterium]